MVEETTSLGLLSALFLIVRTRVHKISSFIFLPKSFRMAGTVSIRGACVAYQSIAYTGRGVEIDAEEKGRNPVNGVRLRSEL